MEITNYKEAIKQTLSYFLKVKGDHKLKHVPLYDEENLRYAVVLTGRKRGEHIHQLVTQIDIVDGKVVIQLDTTDAGLAEGLQKFGVNAADIVYAESINA